MFLLFFFHLKRLFVFFFFFQAEDGIRDFHVTGVQTCALPISDWRPPRSRKPRSRAGWSSVAGGQRRHESIGLRLGGRSELGRQRAEVARGDRTLCVDEDGRKLVPMRIEVLRERSVEDLLRRSPLELRKQAERSMVGFEDPNWLGTNSQRSLPPSGESHSNSVTECAQRHRPLLELL